jgi:Single-strand binding protein family
MTTSQGIEGHTYWRGGRVVFSLNSTTLIGRVSKYGLKLKDGTATGALELVEEGRDEKVHTSYVTILIWGKEGAPQASALLPGSLVLVQGQVRAKKVKDHWTLLIAARELQLLDCVPEQEYATQKAV